MAGKRCAWVIWPLAALAACGGAPEPASRQTLEPTMGAEGVFSEPVSPAASSDMATGDAVVGASVQEYRASLLRRREELRTKLQALPPDKEITERRLAEKQLELIQEKIEDAPKAYVEQRRFLSMAVAAAQLFLEKAEDESWWEVRYALRSGELSLARSVIYDRLARVERMAEEGVAGVDEAELRRLGGQAFLRLAELAESAADYQEALRGYRFAMDYSGDLAVSADAMSGYAELLDTLGRDEEAREVETRKQQLLLRATPSTN